MTYRKTLEYSGNSVIQVVVLDKNFIINDIRKVFAEMGCESEQLNDGYFTMEIPSDLYYGPVREKLLELEEKEIIGYAEPILSVNHQYH